MYIVKFSEENNEFYYESGDKMAIKLTKNVNSAFHFNSRSEANLKLDKLLIGSHFLINCEIVEVKE